MASFIRRWAFASPARTVGRSAFPLLLISVLCLLTSGCADSPPKRSTIRYSPPSVVPVRQQISAAQKYAAAEAAAAGAAQTAIAKARSVISSSSPQSEMRNPELEESLAEASGQVNHLITANAGLQLALGEAQADVDKLEEKVARQTDQLNTANDEKNAALDRADKIAKEKARVEKKYRRLKFLVCSLAAAVATFLAVKLGLLRLLSFLGPWGMLGIAAVPAVVFAVVWRIF